MPRLWCWHGGEALLTSRLRAQRSLPLLIHFTWRLQYRHREATPPKGCSSKCGGQEGSAKMTQIPRPEVSEQLFLHTILLEPFLSSKAGRRSRKSGEGQVSLSHTATELRAIPAARLKCPWPWPAGDSTDGSLGHLEILSKIGNRISTSRLWSLFPVRWTSLYHGIYVVTFHYPPALASSVSSGAQGWLRVSSPHPISFLMDGLPHSALPASVLPVTAHFLLLHCSRSAGQTEAVPWPFTHTNLTEAWRSPVVMVMGRQYPQLHQATVPSPPDRARAWGKKDVGQFRMPCHRDKTRSQMVNVIRNEKSQSWCGSPPHHHCRADNVMRRKGICLLLYSVQQQLTDSDLGPPSTFLHPMYFLVPLTAPPGIS